MKAPRTVFYILVKKKHTIKGSSLVERRFPVKPTVYVRLRKKIEVDPEQVIRLKDICQLVADEPYRYLGNLPVHTASLKNGNYALVDAVHIMRLIKERQPELDVWHIGPTQTLIEIKTPDPMPKRLPVAIVMLILFIGSGLAIMNFHADVSMKEVHARIYYMLTGIHDKHPLLLQIPYSIGIGAGMILFFNRLFKRRFNEEPSPMELEVFLYQEAMEQYIIHDEKQKMGRTTHANPD
ncbi:stage V sporulation protein AA [Thermoactinomyces daqus]|uniref:Stage V sporulation protein AA n=1 Tax=Thermoactinomyces daqus TaxID=1329516 RepID=A0A7W1XAK8_9BACL|nr:stage V sporulation protein AA [Thermoactinomyces daqus]